jgi:ferritin-like metal-binding protein YciE
MAATVSSLNDLLIEEMKDIYHAEKQLTKALPKMAKAAGEETLKSAFTSHLEETQGQIQRLEQAFQMLGSEPKAKTCPGMQGLIEEGQEVISGQLEAPWNDAALINAASKVEHYEIAAYTSLIGLAERLGNVEVAELLQQNLDEEEAADEKLCGICEEVLSGEITMMSDEKMSKGRSGPNGKSVGSAGSSKARTHHAAVGGK